MSSCWPFFYDDVERLHRLLELRVEKLRVTGNFGWSSVDVDLEHLQFPCDVVDIPVLKGACCRKTRVHIDGVQHGLRAERSDLQEVHLQVVVKIGNDLAERY